MRGPDRRSTTVYEFPKGTLLDRGNTAPSLPTSAGSCTRKSTRPGATSCSSKISAKGAQSYTKCSAFFRSDIYAKLVDGGTITSGKFITQMLVDLGGDRRGFWGLL